MASGVVKDRDGNLIIGGGYGSDVEWRPMIWKNGQAELFSTDEGLIIDVDIAADGDILLCNYGSDREYYTKGTTKIYHPEGFNATSMSVSGEDMFVLDGEIYMGGFLNSGNGNSPHAVIWHMTDCSSEADCILLVAGEAERGYPYGTRD